MTGISLRALAEQTGTHASQISRAQRGETVSAPFMRKLERFFTAQGLRFHQFNGTVSVDCPEPFAIREQK